MKWRESKVAVLVVSSLAVFIDMLLYGIIVPIQPALLRECGISQEHIDFHQSLLFGSLALGIFVSTPIFGIVSDRLQNRKMPMLLGLGALAITTVFFAFTRVFALLVIARIAQGVSAAATWVVGFAMLADAYPSDDGLGFAVGIALTAHTVGGFVGPVIGGFLGQFYGLQYPFLLCAALAILDLVGRLLIKPPKPQTKKLSDTNQPTKVGMRSLLTNYRIILTLISVIIISASYSSMELFVASWLDQGWGFSESKISLCFLAFIIPNMISAMVVGWLADRLPRHRLIALGLLLQGLVAPFVPLSQTLSTLIIFAILFGAATPLVSAPITPHLAALVDQMGGSSYARVYAIFNMTWSIGMIIGPWTVGLVKAWKGFFAGMLLLSIFSIIYCPICMFFAGLPRAKSIPVAPSNENLIKETLTGP